MNKYEVIKIDDYLRLIQLQKKDAERMFGLTESNREYLTKWLPWPPLTRTVRDSEDFIEKMLSKREKDEEYGYGIEYGGEIVGHISLMHLKDGESTEIGYWVASDYSGKGITTRAVSALTDLAKNTLGIKKVIIRANVNNIPSNRVAEKAGYICVDQQDKDGEKLNIWQY